MLPGQKLHRSLTFWTGLITILFTSWAWQDSYSHFSSVSRNQLSIISGFRGIGIEHYITASSSDFSTMRTPEDDFPVRWTHEHFPLPFFVKAQEIELDYSVQPPPARSRKEGYQMSLNFAGPGSWALFIPYWLILLPLILTWTALLLFRARRRQRAHSLPHHEEAS